MLRETEEPQDPYPIGEHGEGNGPLVHRQMEGELEPLPGHLRSKLRHGEYQTREEGLILQHIEEEYILGEEDLPEVCCSAEGDDPLEGEEGVGGDGEPYDVEH